MSTGYSAQDYEAGKQLFKNNCASCHNMEKRVVGPALKNVVKNQGEEWTTSWIVNNNKLRAYNTDWIGIYNYFLDPPPSVTILGNGGFSKAIQYACNKLSINFNVITRDKWNIVPSLEGTIINATPVNVIVKGKLIDGRPFTKEGKKIAQLQAYEQYKLYING